MRVYQPSRRILLALLSSELEQIDWGCACRQEPQNISQNTLAQTSQTLRTM